MKTLQAQIAERVNNVNVTNVVVDEMTSCVTAKIDGQEQHFGFVESFEIATKIFASYEDFQNREEREINGVSQDFLDSKSITIEELKNKNVIMSWNCIDCNCIANCVNCESINYSTHCNNCKDSVNLHNCDDMINEEDIQKPTRG